MDSPHVQKTRSRAELGRGSKRDKFQIPADLICGQFKIGLIQIASSRELRFFEKEKFGAVPIRFFFSLV